MAEQTSRLKEQYRRMGIGDKVFLLGQEVERELAPRFARIEENAEYCQLKVLQALRDNQVSEACLQGSTGYGYNDLGRDTLEKVYADLFQTEDALVRPQITCGTHALSIALSCALRPGDEILSPVGTPYNTLRSVIGINPAPGSLKEWGISYDEAALTPEGRFDYEGIKARIKRNTRLVTIQRSRGYATRPSFSVDEIGELICFIKGIRPDIICMEDNCYGEFTEAKEPSEAGADLIAGSLIKNPGGGLAPVGGYIAGKKELVELAAYRLTSPGLGREVGASLGILPSFYQGLFLAPTVVAGALKSAAFAAGGFARLGFTVYPAPMEERHDIVQEIILKNPEALKAFCGAIQSASPVDASYAPEPWPMPGYDCDVIMAAGTFTSGSSIELSADGPMREPYSAYFQGGLTWPHGKFGILSAAQAVLAFSPRESA